MRPHHAPSQIIPADLTNSDLGIERLASAEGITDVLYFHDQASYAVEAITRLACACGVRDVNPSFLGGTLFSLFRQPYVRVELAKSLGANQQYAILPAESVSNRQGNCLSALPASIRHLIPEGIVTALDQLKLCFETVPRRPSLQRLFEQPAPLPPTA
jgi:hypothetical protein